MLKIAIMTIGDEICIGQIVNTNAAWMAGQCTDAGAVVTVHSTIGDERGQMLDELDRLRKINDIVLITGGLGPTHDDITKPVLCEYFDDELVVFEAMMEQTRQNFKRWGIEFTERNRAQAEVPSKCKPLMNTRGTAPGLWFDIDDKIIVALPGVPAEMKGLMTDHVVPAIKSIIAEKCHEVAMYKTLLTTGMPESKLADRIGETTKFLRGGSLAFLPSYQGVKLRIGVIAADFTKAAEEILRIENYIKQRAAEYIYGEGDSNLSAAIGDILAERGQTVAVAESCTGGLLGAGFTANPGSSDYFVGGAITYTDKMKIDSLGVSADTIEKHGAVSLETATEMAAGARNRFGSDYALSITGIAGPGGERPGKPVGTVCIGVATPSGAKAQRFVFGKDRAMNRQRSVGTALKLLVMELL